MASSLFSKNIITSCPRIKVGQVRSSKSYQSHHQEKLQRPLTNRLSVKASVNAWERKSNFLNFRSYDGVFTDKKTLLSSPRMRFVKQQRYYSTEKATTINVPSMGESISTGTLSEWLKSPGDYCAMDEIVAFVETDKINAEIRTPVAGVLGEVFSNVDDTVTVGNPLFTIVPSENAPEPVTKVESTETPTQPQQSQQAPPKLTESKPQPPKQEKSTPVSTPSPKSFGERVERRVKMTQARKRIAQRMKDSQNTYALLTTFNEVDMHNLMQLRKDHKDDFLEKHGVKLGFMSAFAKASAIALMENPVVNGVIDGDEIVYHDFVDISVAVSTPTSLFVPVIRNVESLSFANIETEINNFAKKARDGKLTIEDMAGGTFTISNGGVFGSLMGTPIVNPPQSAILGIHAVNKKPVVVNDKIEIRPMMYIALTYDHRLIDGRDAVTTLKRIKELVEDPVSMLLC